MYLSTKMKSVVNKVILIYCGAKLATSSVYTVDIGKRAVVLDHFRGQLDKDVGEGMHFFRTKHLHMVNLTLDIISRPEVGRLSRCVELLGVDYDKKVIPFIGYEVLESVVAQFTAEPLRTELSRVSELLEESLDRRAKNFSIVVEDVAIHDVSYGTEVSRAVQRIMNAAKPEREVAKQEVERVMFLLRQGDD